MKWKPANYTAWHGAIMGTQILYTWHSPWCNDPDCNVPRFPSRAWFVDVSIAPGMRSFCVLGLDVTFW